MSQLIRTFVFQMFSNIGNVCFDFGTKIPAENNNPT